MIHYITPAAMSDHSALAPVLGSVISMLGMLILVAGSAVHMMI